MPRCHYGKRISEERLHSSQQQQPHKHAKTMSHHPNHIPFHHTPITIQLNYTLQAASHIYIREKPWILAKSKYSRQSSKIQHDQANIYSLLFLQVSSFLYIYASPTESEHRVYPCRSFLSLYYPVWSHLSFVNIVCLFWIQASSLLLQFSRIMNINLALDNGDSLRTQS